MPISETTKTSLEALKTTILEWREAKTTEINDEAAFLKAVDMSLSALAEPVTEEATIEAIGIIEGLIGTTTEDEDADDVDDP